MTFTFNPHPFGAACENLIAAADVCDLGPGTPNRVVADQLRSLDTAALFGEQSVTDHEMASCCIAGLWLLHNFLDESHTISQNIDTTTGSYWHGIMHRREPDFSNAKYWFRRVDNHEIFPALCSGVSELARRRGTDKRTAFLATQSQWDPFAFVDLCEAAMGGRADEALCRQAAHLEWQILFDYCYRSAIGH